MRTSVQCVDVNLDNMKQNFLAIVITCAFFPIVGWINHHSEEDIIKHERKCDSIINYHRNQPAQCPYCHSCHVRKEYITTDNTDRGLIVGGLTAVVTGGVSLVAVGAGVMASSSESGIKYVCHSCGSSFDLRDEYHTAIIYGEECSKINYSNGAK